MLFCVQNIPVLRGSRRRILSRGGPFVLKRIALWLRDHLIKSKSLNATRIVAGSFAVIILVGALLLTLRDLQKNDLPHIRELELYVAGKFMQLDLAARRNLELLETMRNKEKRGSLLWVLDKTRTAMGKRLIRQYVEQPISIAYLKYFAADNDLASGNPFRPEVKAPTGKRVAIVGGGPGGLTAAYYLSLMGHKVTVYEQRPKLGGMLRYGIPDYRLPQDVLDRDITHILSTGITVRTAVSIGQDVAIEEIQKDYDAVYIAIGAHVDKKLGLEGEESSNVISAVELLRGVGDGNVPDFTGKKICVIGGGNVSMDATRTALRLGAESVTCVYRRRVEDMTALAEEIEEAMAEGCQILPLQAPVRIEADEEGKVAALWTQPQIISLYGRDGRPAPAKAQEKEFRIPCDYVIVAIGQAIAAKPFEAVGVTTCRGAIQVDLTSSVPGADNIFAGGDAVSGPATVIRAVAAGKVAAANIDNFLGFDHKMHCEVDIPPAHLTNTPPCGRVNLKNRQLTDYHGNFDLLKEGMSEQEATQEASRCLRCDHFGYGIFKGGRSKEW